MEQTKTNMIESILNSISPNEVKKVETRMLLAAKIADAMKAKGWKKKDLMLAMDKKNQSEITRWLSGTHNFTSDLLTDLGIALNIDFFNLEKPAHQPVIYRISVTVTPALSENSYINQLENSVSYLWEKVYA